MKPNEVAGKLQFKMQIIAKLNVKETSIVKGGEIAYPPKSTPIALCTELPAISAIPLYPAPP